MERAGENFGVVPESVFVVPNSGHPSKVRPSPFTTKNRPSPETVPT